MPYSLFFYSAPFSSILYSQSYVIIISTYFRTFCHPQKKFHPSQQSLLFLPCLLPAQAQETSNVLFSVWSFLLGRLHINGILQYLTFSSLASFTQHHIFKIYPYLHMCQNFISFYEQTIPHCMDIPHLLIHLSIDRSCFWSVMNIAALNIHVHIFVWMNVIISLGHNPRSRIAASQGNSVFSFFLRTAEQFS